MRRRLSPSLLAPWLIAAVGCLADERPAADAPAKPEPSPWTLHVLATGDVGSDTDVCGCKVRRLGGLTRRVHAVKARSGALVLDAGDLFFRTFGISTRHRPQAEATAEVHAEALRMMGAKAVAIGERDLALGVPYLRRLARRAGVELLSANLVHAQTGTAAFSGFTVVEVDGHRVGIVGVSPPLEPKDPSWQAYEEAGVRSGPVVPAVLAAAAGAERAGAQTLVGLFHLGLEASRGLIAALPRGRFTLVLVAGDGRAGQLNLTEDRATALLEVGERGKYLAEVRIRRLEDRPLVDMGAVEEERRLLVELETRIEELEGQAAQADLQKRLSRRRDRTASTLARVDPANSSTVTWALVPMDLDDPEDPQMLTRYRAYQARLERVNAGGPTDQIGYVGHAQCGTCHASALEHWKSTGHARAWRTMVETKQTGNLDCIACHVTGFERPGGPRRLADLGGLRNVGCESCHGPGAAHAADPEAAPLSAQVASKVCGECHRAQGDQKPFVYEERLPRILGPGHGAPAR